MKRAISLGVLILLLCSVTLAQGQAKEKAAAEAAQSWLALVDSGGYGESWDLAASLFQAAITKDKWESSLNQVRAPLGKANSRKLLNAQYTTELPNAPKGEYVLIQYDTNFTTGGAMVETIVPTLDKDGQWRVSGYFVKPAE